jgi:hypothetical protein
MQQKDRFAFVAGLSVGLWGGALGWLLICTAARAAMSRRTDQLDEQYVELSPSVVPGRQLVDGQSSRTVSIVSQGWRKAISAG